MSRNQKGSHLNCGLPVFLIKHLLNILEWISKLLFKHSFNPHFHGGGWARTASTSPCFTRPTHSHYHKLKLKRWFSFVIKLNPKQKMKLVKTHLGVWEKRRRLRRTQRRRFRHRRWDRGARLREPCRRWELWGRNAWPSRDPEKKKKRKRKTPRQH